jgi:hypothetical protein
MICAAHSLHRSASRPRLAARSSAVATRNILPPERRVPGQTEYRIFAAERVTRRNLALTRKLSIKSACIPTVVLDNLLIETYI